MGTKHIIFAMLFSLAMASPAYSYLDPNSGSMFLQAILGGIAGLMVVTRMYWGRIKGLITGKKPEDEAKKAEGEATEAPADR